MHFENHRMSVQKIFDFPRKKIFSAPNDHFLQPPNDFSVAVFIEDELIAGFQPVKLVSLGQCCHDGSNHYHPSASTVSLVFASSFQYPSITEYPRWHNSPGCPNGTKFPALSTTFASMSSPKQPTNSSTMCSSSAGNE